MKQSIIWKQTKDDFQKLINSCSSFREVLTKLQLTVVAGNYETLKRRVLEENINVSQLNENRHKLRITWGAKEKYPDERVFVENSTYNRGLIKKRIMDSKLIPYICSKCSCNPEWMGEKLVLILDHKNGISDDHRLDNLRFLCPNCNSQSSTFAGRNNKRLPSICPICKLPFSGYGKKCKQCWLNNQPVRFNIADSSLRNLIASGRSFRSIGKQYGVSGNTVKSRCQKLGIM